MRCITYQDLEVLCFLHAGACVPRVPSLVLRRSLGSDCAVASVRWLYGLFLGGHNCGAYPNARVGAWHEGHRYITGAKLRGVVRGVAISLV